MTVRDNRNPSSDAERKRMLPPQQQKLAFAGEGARDYDRTIDRRRLLGASKTKVHAAEDAATDTESEGSSEEAESPAGRGRRRAEKKLACLHSQVLRVRDEDLHLGEDIGEGLSAKDKVSSSNATVATASRADIVVFSRPILPCSRLSGKVNPIQSVR